jgi:hypothetical protein
MGLPDNAVENDTHKLMLKLHKLTVKPLNVTLDFFAMLKSRLP